jgi:site-specific recombinase XerD
MRRLRRPLHHPLAKVFLRSIESLTTSLSDASLRDYLATIRRFLDYLGENYTEVRQVDQLRRDPHILGWLAQLRSHTPPFAKITLVNRVIRLHRLLEDLAWTEQLPALAHLVTSDDAPRRDHYLPRSLTPTQDDSIQQELLRRNDLTSNALLLLRHTGMRIGECTDLSFDCLRPLGPEQWVIHVPLGKLKTERWVPVDSFVCQVINRLRLLRSQDASEAGSRFLLARPHGRHMLIREIRAALQDVVATAGINTRIVPHQFRHTYASDMLRGGVSFPAVMKLLGHTTPSMTMLYLEITQTDLQREYHLARAHPRHLAPMPRTPLYTALPRADLVSLIDSLRAAQNVLEMFRRALPDGSNRHLLDRIANRVVKIVAQLLNFNLPQD